MAWHFLNIGKANAEIDRLNSELVKVTKERDDATAAVESNSVEVTKHAEELQGQLVIANAAVEAGTRRVSELETSVQSKDAELATVRTELQSAKDRIANPSAEIVKIASVKAAEITGAQGQPPITTTPAATPAAEGKTALKGIARAQAAISAQIKQS